MNTKKYINKVVSRSLPLVSGFLFFASCLLTSCNDFLDALPDDRIEIDKVENIEALITSAYPVDTYVRLTELASDNVDDLDGDLNGNYDRFSEQCYRWQ